MTRETKVLFPYGISFSGDKSIPKLREYLEKIYKELSFLSYSFGLLRSCTHTHGSSEACAGAGAREDDIPAGRACRR